MADTKINYLDKTWNFIGGCTECGAGCVNCWSKRLCTGRLKNHPLYQGLVKNGKWTGEIRTCLDIGRSDILEQPLHWREPSIIGVEFTGDLFHPKVQFEFIDQVFDTMFTAYWHTYLLLTKRIERMAEYIKHLDDVCFEVGDPICWSQKPNEHIWLGVSISTQKEADEKIPILLQIPAAIRFISAEPLLEPLAFNWNLPYSSCKLSDYIAERNTNYLDWIIVGSESGPKRRPCKLEWIRDIVEQCKAANIPVFVKQIPINGKVSHKMSDWPKWAQIRQWPERSKQG